MKNFFKTKFGESVILTVTSIVNFLFTIAYYSIKMTNFSYADDDRGQYTFWSAKKLYLDTYIIPNFNAIMIAAICLAALLLILSALLAIFKNRKWPFYILSAYSLALSIAVLFIHITTRILRGGALACVILSAVTSTAILIYLIVTRKNTTQDKAAENLEQTAEKVIEEKQRNIKPLKIGMLICECIATAVFLSTFFIPVYSETSAQISKSYYLITALSDSSYPLHMNIAFIVMFAACFAGVLCFVSSIADFARSTKEFVIKSQKYMYVAVFLSAAFFALGYGLTFYLNIAKNSSADLNYTATTVSYIPSFISVAVLIAFSVLQGSVKMSSEKTERAKNAKKFRIEPLIYTVIITGITFATLALNLVELQVSYNGLILQDTKLSGYNLLMNYRNLEGGFQIMAFVLITVLITSGIMMLISIISFFAKNNDYYKVVKTSAFTNFVFMLAVGLFGIYFVIAQKVNEENILALLNYFGVPIASLDYVEKISSQSYIGTIASFAMIVLMLIRGQFNLTTEPTVAEAVIAESSGTAQSDERQLSEPAASTAQSDADATAENSAPQNFDVCPAFTELDMKKIQFEAELNQKRENLFTNLTLPNLVRFVVDYARECRLHLSYSLEDIATFVAGLGASRLSILQGMSGTGKTSLPKIFTEALMGNCEIVEVESSWRDKNELLGYYNEFSKCYTPKKFTQCLYKAKLNSSVLTFIVLDEMNLSRIEYYFSDFLSLMENEEDKREIKLLNIKLFRKENGENIPYLALTDGHTIKIPANVWFIGTANRDESTFEISDKVYDRAQTMNFNKRAPKVHSFSEPLSQRFASYDMICKLFDEAKNEYVFEAEDNAIIQKVEQMLAPYNISFGNRILKQMEDFVKIYCTCFGDKSAVENDAVEKILLSKVVSKLENKIVENKDALANEFSKLGLNKCSAFVQKLNED